MDIDKRALAYLIVIGLLLVVAGLITIYTLVENYFTYRKANKRKVIFKTKNGKTKGYWKTKDGEEYDEDLRLED